MTVLITRGDLQEAIKKVYDEPSKFIIDVQENVAAGFEVFHSIDGDAESSDVLILYYTTGQFISWYKLEHVGRAIQSNIQNAHDLEKFIRYFYNAARNGTQLDAQEGGLKMETDKWINAKEQKPEPYEDVLVLFEYYFCGGNTTKLKIGTAYYVKISDQWLGDDLYVLPNTNVIYWQPIID